MPNLTSLLDEHVVLKYECIDRIYLNGYVAKLQIPDDLCWFLCQHRGEEIPRYEVLGEMTRAFLRAVEAYASECGIPVVHFERGQRKEEVAAPYFARATREGVVMIGFAQERAQVFRAPLKRERQPGKYAVNKLSVYVNHVYFYIWDADFGPGFIKFCTYAPWGMRVWLNGHQWVRRQLDRQRIAYQPLENGIASVADAHRLQQLCDRLSPTHLQRFVDRWLYRLPNPFPRRDQQAGYRYQLSIIQLEVSRTEVFDRPLHGRQFFEEVIHDQLDLGRPERLSILFGRRCLRRREGHRTRVFSQGVDISLHVEHRQTTVKQYWKCDRALRTETTFQNPRQFQIGRRLKNLPALVELGRTINRRLLDLERTAHHASAAATDFEGVVLPSGEVGCRAPGLRFGDPRVVALFGALSQCCWITEGFRSRDVRPLIEHHLSRPYGMAQMAYDLRRLQRKQLVVRVPRSFRYHLTALGRRVVLFCTKLYHRALCRGLGRLEPEARPSALTLAWRRLDRAIDALLQEARLAA